MVTATPASIGVVLVDDHAVVRAGLRMLIESHPGMRVVGEAGNDDDALALVAEQQPEIVVIDFDLDSASGLALLAELRQIAPRSPVLVLTGLHDNETHRRALRLGAMGLVMTTDEAEVLLKAIQRVHAGEIWISPQMLGQVLHDCLTTGPPPAALESESAKIAALTPREREVLALIADGLKNRQIADRLFISETTVRHHLTSIFGKLGVADRLALVLYAFRHHLVKRPV